MSDDKDSKSKDGLWARFRKAVRHKRWARHSKRGKDGKFVKKDG